MTSVDGGGWLIRNGDKNDPVDGIGTLRRLCAGGKISNQQPVFDPRSSEWQYAAYIVEIRDIFGIADPNTPSSWWVQDGNTKARADSFDMLLQWCREGRVKRSTYVEHPSIGGCRLAENVFLLRAALGLMPPLPGGDDHSHLDRPSDASGNRQSNTLAGSETLVALCGCAAVFLFVLGFYMPIPVLAMFARYLATGMAALTTVLAYRLRGRNVDLPVAIAAVGCLVAVIITVSMTGPFDLMRQRRTVENQAAADRYQKALQTREKAELKAESTSIELLLKSGAYDEVIAHASTARRKWNAFTAIHLREELKQVAMYEGVALAQLGRSSEAEEAFRSGFRIDGTVGSLPGEFPAAVLIAFERGAAEAYVQRFEYLSVASTLIDSIANGDLMSKQAVSEQNPRFSYELGLAANSQYAKIEPYCAELAARNKSRDISQLATDVDKLCGFLIAGNEARWRPIYPDVAEKVSDAINAEQTRIGEQLEAARQFLRDEDWNAGAEAFDRVATLLEPVQHTIFNADYVAARCGLGTSHVMLGQRDAALGDYAASVLREEGCPAWLLINSREVYEVYNHGRDLGRNGPEFMR
ncbi:MAG: hypothetical protein ACYC7A_21760 [Thermoanaerobaculia bacterium]